MIEAWIKLLAIPAVISVVLLLLKINNVLLVSYWWVFSPILLMLGWLFLVFTVGVGCYMANTVLSK